MLHSVGAVLCRTLASSKSGINYETNGWFFSDDSIANAMKNRVVITMPLLGLPVSCRLLLQG